ncbi:MAG: hypothetical protein WBG10_14330, partial [Pseudolabrys sp.]
GTTLPTAPGPSGRVSRANLYCRSGVRADFLPHTDPYRVDDGPAIHPHAIIAFDEKRRSTGLVQMARPRQCVVEHREFLVEHL